MGPQSDDGGVLGADTTAQILRRMNRDLRSAPRSLRLELRRNGDGDTEWLLKEADGKGASMSALILEDDELSTLQVERLVVEIADSLAGSLWPDDVTTPWPGCPTAPDHPPALSTAFKRAYGLSPRAYRDAKASTLTVERTDLAAAR